MNCLVTGGAGFIGSHLVDRLLVDKNTVTVVDNFTTGKEENIEGKKIQLVRKDLRDNLDSVFEEEKFDVIFHLAAIPLIQFSIENPLKTNSSIDDTINLLESAKKYKVKRFIYTSSSAIYGNQKELPFREDLLPQPSSPYGIQKLCCEHYCRFFAETYGLETIIFRLFSVYGPRQNPNGSYGIVPKFISFVSRGEPLTVNGDGNQTRDFIFVSDVIDALIKGAQIGNKDCFSKVFNIGTGKMTSINTLVKLISSGRKPQIINGPAMAEQKNTQADITLAKKFLSWEPRTSFEEGIKQVASRIRE